MSIFIPAIIPTSREDLEEKLTRLAGIADEVQIDIVDGTYAGPASWPYTEGPDALTRMAGEGMLLPHAGERRLEIDLMATHPEASAGTWIELGASRITIHAASTPHLGRLLGEFRHTYGHDTAFSSGLLSIGVALNVGMDPESIAPYLSQIDYVQFMGIRTIGKQGQAFDTGVLRAIELFRKRHPTMPVQVDGGVSLASAPRLLEAGVSRLVVGSALWKAPDLHAAYDALAALTLTHGLYE